MNTDSYTCPKQTLCQNTPRLAPQAKSLFSPIDMECNGIINTELQSGYNDTHIVHRSRLKSKLKKVVNKVLIICKLMSVEQKLCTLQNLDSRRQGDKDLKLSTKGPHCITYTHFSLKVSDLHSTSILQNIILNLKVDLLESYIPTCG